MTSPPSPDVADKTSSQKSGLLAKAKTVLTTLLLMALTGGIGYGVGRLQMRGQVQQAETAQNEAIAQLEGQVEAANQSAAAAEARSQINEVRYLLLQSIDELNANNFGNANTQLRSASEKLNQVTLAKDPAKLDSLQKELAEQEINFAINPSEQRRTLLDLANQLTGLLPE